MLKFKRSIFLLAILLCIIGSCMLFSIIGSMTDVIRRVIYVVLGIGLALSFSFVQYQFMEEKSVYIYGIGIVCVLVAASPIGYAHYGVARWIRLGPVVLKVTELMVLCTIMALAAFVAHCNDRYSRKRMLLGIWIIGGISALLLGVFSTDWSNALLIIGITYVISFFFTKMKKLHLILLLCLIIAFGMVALKIYQNVPTEEEMRLLPYWVQRIAIWLRPKNYQYEGGYHILQMLDAIKGGDVFGKGFGMSTHVSVYPGGFTDEMILAIIMEEFGVIGLIVILILTGMLCSMIYRVSMRTDSVLGQALTMGIFVHLTLQSLMNIAIVTNLIPYMGLTFPFVSNGNTALLVQFIEIGLVMSVARESYKRHS